MLQVSAVEYSFSQIFDSLLQDREGFRASTDAFQHVATENESTETLLVNRSSSKHLPLF